MGVDGWGRGTPQSPSSELHRWEPSCQGSSNCVTWSEQALGKAPSVSRWAQELCLAGCWVLSALPLLGRLPYFLISGVKMGGFPRVIAIHSKRPQADWKPRPLKGQYQPKTWLRPWCKIPSKWRRAPWGFRKAPACWVSARPLNTETKSTFLWYYSLFHLLTDGESMLISLPYFYWPIVTRG